MARNLKEDGLFFSEFEKHRCSWDTVLILRIKREGSFRYESQQTQLSESKSTIQLYKLSLQSPFLHRNAAEILQEVFSQPSAWKFGCLSSKKQGVLEEQERQPARPLSIAGKY